jgi:hypothetical protein
MHTITIDRETLLHIISTVNEAGFRGMSVIDWIPPLQATSDRFGIFIYSAKEK